jgi:hypothetical protein
VVDGLPSGIVSAVPPAGEAPADALAAIRDWAERNQPTAWDLPRPVTRAAREVEPSAALWFRIQYVYAPTYVTDPRSILKIGTGA